VVVGLGKRVGELLGARVFVALGTLAVCVAKMFAAILVSVTFASGVGGTGVGVTLGAQPTIAERKTNVAKSKDTFFIVTSPLTWREIEVQLGGKRKALPVQLYP